MYLAPISGTNAFEPARRPVWDLHRHLWDTVALIIEIVILAMIAAFLGLRLYSVLGRRAEHEEEPVPTRFERGEGASAPRPTAPAAAADLPRPGRDLGGFPPATEQGLR